MTDLPQPPTAPARRRLRRALLAVLALAVLVLSGVVALATPAQGAVSGQLGPEATKLVALLNRERVARGLPALRVLPRLVALARAQSADMGADGAPCQEPYLHHNPNLNDQVQPASSWGENVGCAGSADQMHQAFMHSAGHRANILGTWNAVGVGAYDGRLLWGTEDFARVDPGELAAATPVAPAAQARPAAAPRPTAAPRPARVVTARPAARFVATRDWPAVARELRRVCRIPRLFGA